MVDGVGSKNLLQDSSDIMCFDFLVVRVSLTVGVGEDVFVDGPGAAFVALEEPEAAFVGLDEIGATFVALEGPG